MTAFPETDVIAVPGLPPLERLLGAGSLEGEPAVDAMALLQFVETLDVALYTTDANGGITYYNEAAAELWGRRPELGEAFCGALRLYWSDGRPMPHEECPMAIALQEGRTIGGVTAIAERPDGERIEFEPHPSAVLDDAGRVIGGVNVLVDVSTRRRAEAELRATQEALAASAMVKDDFLGLVSHELRTPVTTIYGNAQLLRERVSGLSATEQGMLGDIVADAERLQGIIENLLLLNRLHAGGAWETEPQLIYHVVTEEIAAFARRQPKAHVALGASRPHVVVEADRTHLMVLLQNLLGNAAKYGGDAPIDVVVEEEDGHAIVRVLDRGLGIEDEDIEHLFRPFYRARDAQLTASGLGLGLAVCARIVDELGGRIWAKRRDGGGSEFGFAIPIAADGA
jgi:PAS domain S-box-containing protein